MTAKNHQSRWHYVPVTKPTADEIAEARKGWTDTSVADPGPVYGWDSEPDLPRIGLGIPNRSKRLTALGNACVPAQVVFAWHRLSERLGLE